MLSHSCLLLNKACLLATLLSLGGVLVTSRAEVPKSSLTTPDSPQIEIVPSSPSGIALIGEPAIYKITLRNPAPDVKNLRLITTIQIPDGKPQERATEVSIPARGEIIQNLELPTTTPGYWGILCRLENANKQTLTIRESALAVVPRPTNLDQAEPESFFGTMFIRDAAAAARLGVKSERVQVCWEWLEPTPGTYTWESLDARMSSLAQNHISVVLTIRPEILPKWTKWKSLEELSSPEQIGQFSKFVTDVVSRYKSQILAVEIINEPDLECARHAPGLIPATEVYARLLKVGYQASKAVAPTLPVIALDVSGGDFPNLTFCKKVVALQPKSFDIIGGHPYASARYVGGDARPISPLKLNTAGRFQAMADLMKQCGIPPRVWATEFGWALHRDEPVTSSAARLHAAYVAQAIILTRTIREAEKLFWFNMAWLGHERECAYGLVRGTPYYPVPAAAAYATCSRFLDKVKFLNEFKIEPLCQVARFRKEDSTEVFALWLEEPRSVGGAVKMPLPKDRSDLTLINGLGTPVESQSALLLEALPTFVLVPTAKAAAFQEYLKTVKLEASKRIGLGRISMTNRSYLTAEVSNNSTQNTSIKLYLSGSIDAAQSQKLRPGRNLLKIPLPPQIPDESKQELILSDDISGSSERFPFEYKLNSLLKITANSDLDRTISALSSGKTVELVDRDKVLPADPGIDWKGPSDLSLKANLGWNDDGVYLLMRVTDDIHIPTSGTDTAYWRHDSLQIAFDLSNRADSGFDDNCREFTLALNDTGAHAVQSYPDSMPVDPSQIRISRNGSTTSYAIFLPWKFLRIAPLHDGDILRINFVANDDDGKGRKCWIGFAPGIVEEKRPSAYGQWVLVGPQTTK